MDRFSANLGPALELLEIRIVKPRDESAIQGADLYEG
jgi:hypothetical protein